MIPVKARLPGDYLRDLSKDSSADGGDAIHCNEAKDTEQVLAAAGFQAKPANTPAKRANLRALPPRQLVSQAKDGKFVYFYADPDTCQRPFLRRMAEAILPLRRTVNPR